MAQIKYSHPLTHYARIRRSVSAVGSVVTDDSTLTTDHLPASAQANGWLAGSPLTNDDSRLTADL